MYEFFEASALRNRGAGSAPFFNYIREGVNRDISRVVEYFRERSFIVPNDHILVQLIRHLNVSMQRDLYSYAGAAEDRMASVARTFKITSSLNLGRIHEKGDFYGVGNEVWIADDTDYDIEHAMANWQTLEPVKILRHPFTDLSCGIASGDYKGSDEKGIVIISIHFAKLAIQYRGWYLNERNTSLGGTESVAQFVRRYPITNTIYSHMDLVLFNRFYYRRRGFQLAPYRRIHPINVIDYSARCDFEMDKLIEQVLLRQRTFEEYLLNLPNWRFDNMLPTFVLPDVVPTRQIEWALILARMPLIIFLLSAGGDRQHPANRHYLNRIRLTLRELRNDRAMASILPPDVYSEFEQQVQTYINPYTGA